MRLDVIIATRYPELSRNTAAQLLREGVLQVAGKICKPGYKPPPGCSVTGTLPELADDGDILPPDAIPIDILYEDTHLLALNKPPGLVVHPSAGHDRQTLANALIHHRPELIGIGNAPGRPGIVHRLDKETSGAILVAKTEAAFQVLSTQFRDRRIEKIYLGLAYGNPAEDSGQIDLPIGRHLTQRKKMSATHFSKGRHAQTYWQVKRRYGRITLMEYAITTGRTHQIRVHSAAIHCPLVGDTVYGIKKPGKYLSNHPKLLAAIKSINRQMLHAWHLHFRHPETGHPIHIEAPLTPDMAVLLEHLNEKLPSS